jgi:Fe-Mn family superoxide dismutase
METKKTFALPQLPYEYNALAPFISEEQLTLHHTKHHQAYVTGANAIFEKFEKSRREQADFDVKATLKELSFHIGGYTLHNLFWKNLAPAGKGGGGLPVGILDEAIKTDFGSFERFKKEYTTAAMSVEGSGWAVLSYCTETGKLLIMQIEKHNINVFPGYPILMALDVWEHAYYHDYKNDRARFIESFWNIVRWDCVLQNLKKIQ